MPRVSYTWKPIEALPEPSTFAIEELDAFGLLWRRQRKRLEDKGLFDRFWARLVRSWSIETGIIERIYDISEGVTRVLVEQGFEAALIPHGETALDREEVVAILNDHRSSLDMVMDVVGGTRELTVGWIKDLHALLTRHQKSTTGLTETGQRVELPLLHGEFKARPNNPHRFDGSGVHEYCPPVHVASEMERLVDLYHAMPDEHPEVRAAWLHHAFTQIHPFQDGNGRVARALASIDFIRAGWFPLLVTRDQKAPYLDALRRADGGDLAPLVQHFAGSQERLLARAVSVAEDTVSSQLGLDAILEAADARRQERADDYADLRAQMAERMRGLVLEDGRRALLDVARLVMEKVQHVSTRVRDSEPGDRHWYRQQLIAIARQRDYWADMNDQRYWARLQLKNGGTTDLVLATHFIGSISPGAAVALVFLDHRGPDEHAGDHRPVTVPSEPLTLVVDEQPDVQRRRFGKWLEAAIRQALAQWVRFL